MYTGTYCYNSAMDTIRTFDTSASLVRQREERQGEIARVMGIVAAKKAKLRELISQGLDTDTSGDAKVRAGNTHGLLGDLWCAFLALPADEQIAALDKDTFRGMHWQSMMGSHPFFGLLRV